MDFGQFVSVCGWTCDCCLRDVDGHSGYALYGYAQPVAVRCTYLLGFEPLHHYQLL
jgi:hypothetical protein